MAGLVFVQLWWGWRTTFLAPGYDKLDAYAVHAMLGALLLLLAFLRGGWRVIAPFVLPDLEKPEDLPGWQRLAAEATHVALYVLMFAMPLSGWLMLSANAPNGAIRLPLGMTLPPLPLAESLTAGERANLEHNAETAHLALVWIMMTLVALHVGAALKHQFVDRDTVMARMIPWLTRRPERAPRAAQRLPNRARPPAPTS
jgi:cytochrome b561